jgi:hypothetical protein
VTAQLPELVRLRWRMVRVERVRIGLLVMLSMVPGLICAAVIAGQLLPHQRLSDVAVLAPTAFLGFAVLSLVAPLAAGGGNELFPPDQLVSFPISAKTEFRASLLVAPLNLAWMSQVLVVFAVTSFLCGDRPGLGLALITTLVYVVAVTTGGQAVAWAVIGIRQTRLGRQLLWALAGAILASIAVVFGAHWGFIVLDHAPTRVVVSTVTDGSSQRLSRWTVGTAGLALAAVVAVGAGERICGWALRRPGDAGRDRFDAPRKVRTPARTELGAIIRVDRASVWRSPPLRRGLFVLALLPGVAAAATSLNWDSLVLVPALVAAGAGLLFGVNLFCLDAGGATWLATLPYPPRRAVLAKTVVLVETVGGSSLFAAAIAAVHAAGRPTTSDLVSLVGGALACAAVVVATCLHISVQRPGRAELRSNRDTPAPPAAMAVYSARLATVTTLLGLVFGTTAHQADWRLPAIFAIALVTLGAVSVLRTMRRYDDPAVHARIVTAVSSG